MADLSNVTFQPQNPDALFSPDQWLNQYSLFSNKALPWPSSYAGAPTDAMGNPIQSYTDANNAAQSNYQAQLAQYNAGQGQQQTPGTTLNSVPGASTGGTGLDDVLGAMGMTQFGQQMAAKGISQRDIAGLIGLPGVQNIGAPQQAAPAGPAPPAPPNMWQATLSALANPGKVTTPGANVPAGPSSQPGAGVNNAFLGQAQGKPGMNQNFLSALAALQGAGRG